METSIKENGSGACDSTYAPREGFCRDLPWGVFIIFPRTLFFLYLVSLTISYPIYKPPYLSSLVFFLTLTPQWISGLYYTYCFNGLLYSLISNSAQTLKKCLEIRERDLRSGFLLSSMRLLWGDSVYWHCSFSWSTHTTMWFSLLPISSDLFCLVVWVRDGVWASLVCWPCDSSILVVLSRVVHPHTFIINPF